MDIIIAYLRSLYKPLIIALTFLENALIMRLINVFVAVTLEMYACAQSLPHGFKLNFLSLLYFLVETVNYFHNIASVSYTHLDVYKRQQQGSLLQQTK